MPFSQTKLLEINKTLDEADDDNFWQQGENELREQHERIATFLQEHEGDGETSKVRQRFEKFEMRYNQTYIHRHNLQRFLAQLAQHAVRSKSAQPINEMISSIDKKIVH